MRQRWQETSKCCFACKCSLQGCHKPSACKSTVSAKQDKVKRDKTRCACTQKSTEMIQELRKNLPIVPPPPAVIISLRDRSATGKHHFTFPWNHCHHFCLFLMSTICTSVNWKSLHIAVKWFILPGCLKSLYIDTFIEDPECYVQFFQTLKCCFNTCSVWQVSSL